VRRSNRTAGAIVALLFLVLSVVAGCATDTSRAIDFVRQGDDQLIVLKSRNAKLDGEVRSLFESTTKGLASGAERAGASFDKGAGEIKERIGDATRQATLARAAYENVLKLKGVIDYSEYAGLQAKAVDLYMKSLRTLRRFLDDAGAMLRSSHFAPVAFLAAARNFSEQTLKLAEEIDNLESRADALKKSKKLR
jgi:hypothetical protein